ncbi:MAG: flagellar FlbD family protein [Okeania sp. SIO3C4]|nr:flagellar FlbD family protein [Okeania sp. SIO3C4]
MIQVTRLNGTPFVVNAELIKIVEQTPDTVIKLTTGDNYMVQETPDQVIQAAVEYNQLLRGVFSPS